MKTKFYNKALPFLSAVGFSTLSFFLTSCGSSSTSTITTDPPVTATPPIADYGDAPDGGATGYPAGFAQTGQFPSLFASGGAHTLDITAASLGPAITEENDANVINVDIDDGIVSLFTTLTSIPPPTTMTVNVTGTESGDYFFNSLIDLNMDGKWGGATGANGESEWVVQNLPVTVTAGVVTPVTSPPFAYTNGLLVPSASWMRIALTKEQVPQDWDGTGQFSKGEIEDHAISMPMVNGKEVPMLTVACGGPYTFGPNDQTIPVSCTVTNLRDVAGNFSHSVIHEPNGGTVGVGGCAPAGPLAIGKALGPTASKIIGCTATKGNTPDAWTFKATAIDPLSFAILGGVVWGHSAEAVAVMQFKQVLESLIFLKTFDVTFQHTNPGVFSDLVILGLINAALVNAQVQMLVTGPNGFSQEVTATTDAQGKFNELVKIFVFGLYAIEVQNILLSGFTYTPASNEATTPANVEVQ